MDMSDNAGGVIFSPKQGDRCMFDEKVIVHLGGAQTGGKLTLGTEITPPGSEPPSHYHTNEDKVSVGMG